MFQVGDIVQIQPRKSAIVNSVLWNLEGSICKIIYKKSVGYCNPFDIYNLEILELHAKNKDLIVGDEGSYSWRNEHFILIKDAVDINENEIIDIIG